MYNLSLTKEQVELVLITLSDEMESIQDYINDGTYDDDQDEKTAAQIRVNELSGIIEQLHEQCPIVRQYLNR